MEASALPRQRALVPRSRRLLAALGDDRLVEQVRRGNSAAFEVLYDRHYRGILSFCRHMLGSREEAEDALQQTFASAFTDLQANDRDIRLKAWLYTIARNRCLSILRARREQPAELDDMPTAGLTEEVQQRADLRELLGDLRELPEDQREALVLFELGDLSHAEVANVIGVEPVKVKALVFQARSSLIENREARSIPCAEIREQLATATGGALRRGPLRRHLKSCDGCCEYRDHVRSQRRAMALLLPVVPTAGLKDSVLAAVGLGGGAGGGGLAAGGAAGGAAGVSTTGGSGALGGGGLFAAIGGAGAAKIAIAATVGMGAVAGGGVAVKNAVDGDTPATAKAAGSAPASPTSIEARDGRQGPPSTTPANERAGERSDDRARDRARKKDRARKRNGRKAAQAAKGPNGGKRGNGGRRADGRGIPGSRGSSGGRAQGPQPGQGNGGRSTARPPRPAPIPGGNAGGATRGGEARSGGRRGSVDQPAVPVLPDPGGPASTPDERATDPVAPPKPPRVPGDTSELQLAE